MGCVDQLGSREGCSEWQFTTSGMREIAPARQLMNPQPVLAVRPSLALNDKDAYELMLLLDDGGWRWQHRKQGQPVPPYAIDDEASPKTYYTTGNTLLPQYARCLFRAEELLLYGHRQIEHGRSMTYYNKLLKPNDTLPQLGDKPIEVDLGIADALSDVGEGEHVFQLHSCQCHCHLFTSTCIGRLMR